MSKKMKRSADFEPIEYDEVPEEVVATEQEQNVEVPEIVEKPEKSLATRLLGVLLLVLSVVPFFIAVGVIKGTAIESVTLLDAITKAGDANVAKLFGALPVYMDTATACGVFAGLALYVFAATLAVAAVCGVLTAITASKCTLKVAVSAFAFGAGAYAVSLLVIPAVLGWKDAAMDIVSLALMAVGAILYLVVAFKSTGKKAGFSLFMLILSVVAFALCVLCFKDNLTAWHNYCEELGITVKTVALVVFLLIGAGLVYDALRLFKEKGFKADMVRYIVGIIVYAAVLGAAILSKEVMFIAFSAVAFVISVALPLLVNKQRKAAIAQLEEEYIAKADLPVIEEEVEPEFVVEEYAEAMPYDGGPVEGVEVAQEVNPTFEDTSIPTHVNTAGYDFYNCKSFDPFIAILNNEERNQFTELFILKFKGVMPEIPDYQVGGDNKEFFRKIFIYLGQYRDRIPDGLLAKMYQFNIKL